MTQHTVEFGVAGQATGAAEPHIAGSMVRQSDADGLWRVVPRELCDHCALPCGRGSRACGCASARWVEMSASCSVSPGAGKRERDFRDPPRGCQTSAPTSSMSYVRREVFVLEHCWGGQRLCVTGREPAAARSARRCIAVGNVPRDAGQDGELSPLTRRLELSTDCSAIHPQVSHMQRRSRDHVQFIAHDSDCG